MLSTTHPSMFSGRRGRPSQGWVVGGSSILPVLSLRMTCRICNGSHASRCSMEPLSCCPPSLLSSAVVRNLQPPRVWWVGSPKLPKERTIFWVCYLCRQDNIVRNHAVPSSSIDRHLTTVVLFVCPCSELGPHRPQCLLRSRTSALRQPAITLGRPHWLAVSERWGCLNMAAGNSRLSGTIALCKAA